MRTSALFARRLLPVILTASLLHAPLTFAASCDLPMFAGPRLFAAPQQLNTLITADFNRDGSLTWLWS